MFRKHQRETPLVLFLSLSLSLFSNSRGIYLPLQRHESKSNETETILYSFKSILHSAQK